MSIERELARLERQVLGAARVRRFTDAVDELRRLLAREDPSVRARVLRLVAPSIGRDLAAAVSSAFDLGVAGVLRDLDAPPRVTARPPREMTAAARATEREIAADLRNAKRLARAGAEPEEVMAPVNAAANRVTRDVTTLVNRAGNAGTTAAADAAELPTVWVAETNACVTCLAYSGRVTKPGEDFPAGRSYGRRSSVTEAIPYPPAHPHCRCQVEALNDQGYADALRREADRSVLRGFSLESESMATRVDAAARLLDRGVEAPKSVKAYAAAAVKRGEFTTRGRP